MLKRLQTRIPASVQKIRLDHFLQEWLPNAIGIYVTKTRIRRLILSGAVYVNRRRLKNGTFPLYTGAFIEVYYDEEKLNKNAPKRLEDIRISTDRIVYEDEWLIIVDKPAGIPTQPTVDPTRANLFELVRRMLAKRDKVEDPYVGLHHRLDRDTSGLVLFTKKTDVNKAVADMFQSHLIRKSYQCLVWRSPIAPGYKTNDTFVIENYIGKIMKNTQKISRFGSVGSGGDFAKTEFRVIEEFRDVLWLEAKPVTGRTHQIRVHCSEHGLPILGDPIYFPKDVYHTSVAPRLILHAAQLTFPHPKSQELITVSATMPDDFVQMLSVLKA